jgi:hypothetical protein
MEPDNYCMETTRQLLSAITTIIMERLHFGTWNNATIADLDSWKMATTQDVNSQDVNPQYMSDVDLHVSNILLNGVGQSLPAVTIDIDGEVRDPMPDIGADEFDPSIANDAGVFMYLGPNAPFTHGTQPVTVALKKLWL